MDSGRKGPEPVARSGDGGKSRADRFRHHRLLDSSLFVRVNVYRRLATPGKERRFSGPLQTTVHSRPVLSIRRTVFQPVTRDNDAAPERTPHANTGIRPIRACLQL